MKIVYERLTVCHFGPISNLDITIRPMTLFIGTQGSGKSTIAKLLTFCRETLRADILNRIIPNDCRTMVLTIICRRIVIFIIH